MKPRILFFLPFNLMCGTFTSILDAWRNTKRFIPDVEFLLPTGQFSLVSKFIDDIPKDISVISAKRFPPLAPDICVTSTTYFLYCTLQPQNVFPVKPKKWILLDSSCLMISQHDPNNNGVNKVVELIKQLDNYVVLGNNFNSQFFDSDHYVPYLHKFDWERVYENQRRYIVTHDTPLTVEEYSKTRTGPVFPYTYPSYDYHRWVPVGPNLKFENIGKLIFEFLLIGRQVKYSTKNRSFPDGLTEYLAAIGIDDTRDQILDFDNKQEMKNLMYHTLGYGPKDTLLQMLR